MIDTDVCSGARVRLHAHAMHVPACLLILRLRVHTRMHPNDQTGSGKALKPGFDSHLFSITQPSDFSNLSCYGVMHDNEPDFDEMCVKEEKQVLPLALVRYRRT